MAKIKINKLPEGFKLVNGKVVEDQVMQQGGDVYVTGDQANYGLVTTPQEYYGSTSFNNEQDKSVRYSLSKVPRDVANVEAEGGETVLTDLNDDGKFGLYNISGKRHSQGGVPMFLPEQSFIYSDTPKLKFTKEEMSEFDMGGSRKTPAKISQKFNLNDYYAEIGSQFADDISTRSAELMIQKNMNDLSKLGFMQEAKKNFDDGVPLIAHPYLLGQGIDPLEFTSQVEGISQAQARENAIQQLPTEQQNMIQMLQNMMAQENQAGAVAQGTQGPPEFSANQAQLAQADTSMMNMAKNGLETFIPRYQTAGESPEEVDNTDIIIQENPFVGDPVNTKKYLDAISKGYVMTYDPATNNYNFKLAPKGKFPGGSGSERRVPTRLRPDSTAVDIYNEDISLQGEVIDASDKAQYKYGSLSGGKRSRDQGKVKGAKIYGSEDILLEENKEDFYTRWGDVIEAEFGEEGFNYSDPSEKEVLRFQKAAEAKRKEEALAANIPYVPYFLSKDDPNWEKGRGFDGDFGLHTFNTPRLNVGFEPGDEFNIKGPEAPIEIPPVIPSDDPGKPWWQQDVNNLQALNMFDSNLYLPFQAPIQERKIDYVLDDPTTIINANLAAQGTMADALGNYGPQAIARSNIQGTTLDANAKAISGVNQANVQTMNKVGMLAPQFGMQYDKLQNDRTKSLYDNTIVALQNKDNEDNWKTMKANELFNVGATNASNTYNLNSLNDMYKIGADQYGDIEFTGRGRQPYEDPKQNAEIAFAQKVQRYEKYLGRPMDDKTVDALYRNMVGGLPQNTANMNNAQVYSQEYGAPIGYRAERTDEPDEAKDGNEMKKFAINPAFYTGKMGM